MNKHASLLINNLRARGASVNRCVIRRLETRSYKLLLQTDEWPSVEIECPQLENVGEGFTAVLVDTKTRLKEIVQVPSCFVALEHPCGSPLQQESCLFIVDRSLNGKEMRLNISVDILGLLLWAAGLSPESSRSLRNWSEHVPRNLSGFETSYPYVDRLLSSLVSQINGNRPRMEMNGCILITGDTDSATEAEIINYLDAIETSGAHATLLLRKPEQLSERLIRQLDDHHDLGIHPFSSRNVLSEFACDARKLTQTIKSRTGRDPVACRHHRYQWFEPSLIRSLMKELKIRCELNLVAASGNCWLGAPTGTSFLAVGDAHEAPLWLVPTVVEDEVFIYNLDYCFNHSTDRRVLQPTRFILEFLDFWVLSLGLPACINLHPEHSITGYRRLQDSVLRWANANDVQCPTLSYFLSNADKSIDHGDAHLHE